MSGSNQHFIPQFFLKAFRVRENRQKTAWLFTRDSSPQLKPIKEIAADFHFYSNSLQDDEQPTDTAITKYENKLASIIFKLRRQPRGLVQSKQAAAEAVTHLTIRTNSVRAGFTGAAAYLISRAHQILASEQHLAKTLGLDDNKPNDRFRKHVSEILADKRITMFGASKAQQETAVFHHLKQNFPKWMAENAALVNFFITQLQSRVSKTIRESQNKLLAETSTPTARMNAFAEFEWSVVDTTQLLILADCVAIGYHADNSVHPLTLVDLERLTTIAMPLSSQRILVGNRKEFNFDENNFNVSAAACSEEFFVSASNTVSLINLSIGTRARALLNEAIEAAISEYLISSTT